MCGICGFLGSSKNPKATYEIMTKLLARTEIRGTDATGFWCAQKDDGENKGKISWDKQPIKSSQYVKDSQLWQNTLNLNPAIMIAHCRQPTKIGTEKVNSNNHPHVSDDSTIAVVHNGKIPEYDELKKEYETLTECDSEILLRIFEHSSENKTFNFEDTDEHILYRLNGIKDIFARVNFGAMAVAIGEYLNNGERHLWLFRDKDRPLVMVDLTETLGQIFFCSTDRIWENTVDDLGQDLKRYIPKTLMLMHEYQVFVARINSKNTDISFDRFRIRKTKSTVSNDAKKEDKKLKKNGDSPTEVITSLPEENNPKNNSAVSSDSTAMIVSGDASSDITVPDGAVKEQDRRDSRFLVLDKEKYKDTIDQVHCLLTDIETNMTNMTTGKEMGVKEYDDVLAKVDEVQEKLQTLEKSVKAE